MFIYSEKATKFCENVVPVKSKVKISQNFVAFSEYMNFIYSLIFWAKADVKFFWNAYLLLSSWRKDPADKINLEHVDILHVNRKFGSYL